MRWEELFQVVGMQENLAMVAAIMILVVTVMRRAVADHLRGVERVPLQTLGEL